MYSLKESLSCHQQPSSKLTYFSTLKSKIRRIYRHKYRSLVLILFILPILIFSSDFTSSSSSSYSTKKHNSITNTISQQQPQNAQEIEINQRQRIRQLFKRDISSNIHHDGPEPFPILQDPSSAEVIKHEEEKNKSGQLFPPDLFTLEERRQGWVILYILGVTYMFVALAIVCDEFFVPSLDVIIEKLEIQDDVAGATFMAAGGSAPELFTSVIGVFISHDDVGIGTIVGSAVFNILFVIGMCALFSRTVLHLTWWPLFRDCTFYSIALLTLISFFYDSHIHWWEALILLCVYISYVCFMKYNQGIEKWIKKVLYKNKVTRVGSSDQLVVASGGKSPTTSSTTPGSQTSSVVTVAPSTANNAIPGGGGTASTSSSHRGSSGTNPGIGGRRNSIPLLHSGTKFRHGLLQLMIQSIDPLNDGRIDEKATQLHAIASLKALLDAAKADTNLSVKENNQKRPIETSNYQSGGNGLENMASVDIEEGTGAGANGTGDLTAKELATLDSLEASALEPLDISWPSSDWRKQVSYVLLFPIMIVLYLTLPDTRTPRGKKFFVWGFLGSILWIAIFSYFMVWWADRTGETFRIPPEIMGLTFLAAGTSIPDLITSVIVARKGLGDMAVSSSIGSNIFDVCVGLPVPWLLYTLYEGHSIEVQAKGMLCSVAILFGMLVFVVMSIMIFRWRMNKGLGTVMFLLYFVFLAVSLLFEYQVWTCPKFGLEVTTTTMSPFA